ncbi:peptide ABC transporter substrate-binding protein [Ruminococcaceae bacterium OttesenSCG-928-N02]|nr:peptide ABC transporter substrate-binding protein [Ruminococcaceae bacterium OttesenSCG-928-N02]
MKKTLALILALGMALSMFAACGGNAGSSSGDGAGANALVYNLGSEPTDLSTITSTEGYSFNAVYMMVDGLLSLDEQAVPVPALAQEWEYDEQTLTYTFHLREDATWNNGEAVTAHDFVFAWRTIVTPETAADYAYLLYMIKNGAAVFEGGMPAEELGVQAIDDYTLEVQLEQPCGYALFMFTFPTFFPINESMYTEFGDLYATDVQYMAMNGRYLMTEWVHEDHITFEANPAYYAPETVGVEKITFVMISDSNAAANAFRAGEIDILPQIAGEIVPVLAAEGHNVNNYNNNSARYLAFNQEGVFGNENIRRAFAYAYSRADLANVVLADGSIPAYSFCSEVFMGYEDTFIVEAGAPFFDDANVAQAVDYLELGMEELGITRDDFAGITIIVDENSIYQKVVAYLLEQWKINLGVEITAEVMPKKSRLERQKNRDFDIAYATWGPDYNDPNTYLELGRSTVLSGNNWNYNNPHYDELLALAAAESDVQQRMAYLAECELIMSGDCVVSPMYFECANYAISPKVANYVPSGFNIPLRYIGLA